MSLAANELEELVNTKSKLLKDFFTAEPPSTKGEDLLELWNQIYDDDLQSTVVQTVDGPSDQTSPVFPYEKLYALLGDGGNWKWPRIWRRLDELERRGTAYRSGEPLNVGMRNPNPHVVPQRVLVVGGGPVGLRLAIALQLGGHQVTVFEKRREVRNENGRLENLGFTNRINRPHVFNFLRNDLDRLNGKDFMSSKMCYPVFTQADTSSIGIDELQILLLKNALLLGVDFRLGVAYEDAQIVLDPKTQKPQWQVQCSYDAQAAATFKVAPGSNAETYDVLMGCDGARSRVRESQPQIFGEVDKRNFKKMIGVVANVQKVPRQRLRELGFKSGLEPTDMKRAHLSSGGMTGLNYYKASYHNYVIFTPSKEDLERAGFSGNIYSFHEGRAQAHAKDEEKRRLKTWVLERCQEVGIPVDPKLSNDGFVEAPNDVMAFDFSEIWKCKKNFAFNLPPLDYDAETHGPWTGKSLVPPIGLVGDAVTEPFWIAGVGLQRGWNGAMDACYIIDNLYNLTFSGGCEPMEPCSWNEHNAKLQEMLPVLYDYSHDGRLTTEGLQGEHADQGVVMTQLRKQGKDAEKPQWQLEIDPFARYEPLAKLAREKYKGAKSSEHMHPVVSRTLAIRKLPEHADAFAAKKLLSLGGRRVVLEQPGKDQVGPCLTKPNADAGIAVPTASPMAIPEPEVAKASQIKTESLHNMLAQQIDVHVRQASARKSSSTFHDELWKEIPQDGFAQMAETKWDIMTEQHLSPMQRAELLHVRNMKASLQRQIEALKSSLEAFERAERELLVPAS